MRQRANLLKHIYVHALSLQQRNRKCSCQNLFALLAGYMMTFTTDVAFADDSRPYKGPAPIYQNTFDLAAGGASLTRATMDGMIASNPSLPALGPGFLRWIFFRTGFEGAAAPVSLIQDSIRKRTFDAESLAALTNAHFNFGQSLAGGFVTSLLSGMVFSKANFDIQGKPSELLPDIPQFDGFAAAHTGVYATASKSVGDWLALGANTKFIYAAQADMSVTPQELVQKTDLMGKAQEALKRGQALGVDLGVTFQKRTPVFDLRVATTIDDVGQSKFTGDLEPWKQIVSVGAAFTLHTQNQALHCAYDVRDAGNEYGAPLALRTYTGCRFVFPKFFALAAGYGQQQISYGLLLNLLIMRFEAGSYGKTFGTAQGYKSRRFYYLAMGFEIP